MKYETTIFYVDSGRGGKSISMKPLVPPKGDNWKMVNFHPVHNHLDTARSYFVAVWEKQQESGKE